MSTAAELFLTFGRGGFFHQGERERERREGERRERERGEMAFPEPQP